MRASISGLTSEKRLRRVSSVGNQIGRRSLEVTPAVFAFASLWTETQMSRRSSTSRRPSSFGSVPFVCLQAKIRAIVAPTVCPLVCYMLKLR